MRALEDRGFILRERRSRRAITILRRPSDNRADIDFAIIPEDPVDIEAEINALDVLIAARLTVLDEMAKAGDAEGTVAELDFSEHGSSPRGNGFEEAIV